MRDLVLTTPAPGVNVSRRFLVVGMQRSGTTLVHQILAGHPEVFTTPREAASRLFTDLGDQHFSTSDMLFPLGDTRATSALEAAELTRLYFDAAVAHAGPFPPHAVRGLKVATGQDMDARAMAEAITQRFRDLAVIIVKRADPVAACASFLFANNTRQGQTFEGEAAPTPRFTIPRDYLLHYLRNWHAINRELDKLSALPKSLTVVYERDIAGGSILDGKALFNFLGLSRVPVTWASLRKSLPQTREMVVNLPECEAIASRAVDALNAGANFGEIYRRHGPSPVAVAAHLARHAMRHPGAVRLKSFWAPLGWSLGVP